MIIDFNHKTGGGSGSTVSWNQELSAGTEIAKITINGTQQNVYAPAGGAGSSNYNDLTNKPQIAGVTLSGNTALETLGAATKLNIQKVAGDISACTEYSAGTIVYVDKITTSSWVEKQALSDANEIKIETIGGESGYIQISGWEKNIWSLSIGGNFISISLDFNVVFETGNTVSSQNTFYIDDKYKMTCQYDVDSNKISLYFPTEYTYSTTEIINNVSIFEKVTEGFGGYFKKRNEDNNDWEDLVPAPVQYSGGTNININNNTISVNPNPSFNGITVGNSATKFGAEVAFNDGNYEDIIQGDTAGFKGASGMLDHLYVGYIWGSQMAEGSFSANTVSFINGEDGSIMATVDADGVKEKGIGKYLPANGFNVVVEQYPVVNTSITCDYTLVYGGNNYTLYSDGDNSYCTNTGFTFTDGESVYHYYTKTVDGVLKYYGFIGNDVTLRELTSEQIANSYLKYGEGDWAFGLMDVGWTWAANPWKSFVPYSSTHYTGFDEYMQKVNAASAITTPVEGQIAYETGNKDIKFYNGTEWKALATGSTNYQAGTNITISGNVISAQDTTYVAGTGIQINGNTINCTVSGGGGGECNYHIVEDLSAITTPAEGMLAYVKSHTAYTVYPIYKVDYTGLEADLNDWYRLGISGFSQQEFMYIRSDSEGNIYKLSIYDKDDNEYKLTTDYLNQWVFISGSTFGDDKYNGFKAFKYDGSILRIMVNPGKVLNYVSYGTIMQETESYNEPYFVEGKEYLYTTAWTATERTIYILNQMSTGELTALYNKLWADYSYFEKSDFYIYQSERQFLVKLNSIRRGDDYSNNLQMAGISERDGKIYAEECWIYNNGELYYQNKKIFCNEENIYMTIDLSGNCVETNTISGLKSYITYGTDNGRNSVYRYITTNSTTYGNLRSTILNVYESQNEDIYFDAIVNTGDNVYYGKWHFVNGAEPFVVTKLIWTEMFQ